MQTINLFLLPLTKDLMFFQGDYMNYNNMGGHPGQAGMPNGHHPMQGGMGGADDQNMMSNRTDQTPDAFRQPQMGGQFNNQQQMG